MLEERDTISPLTASQTGSSRRFSNGSQPGTNGARKNGAYPQSRNKNMEMSQPGQRSKKFRLVDTERLKADVYREYTGRRRAIDLGPSPQMTDAKPSGGYIQGRAMKPKTPVVPKPRVKRNNYKKLKAPQSAESDRAAQTTGKPSSIKSAPIKTRKEVSDAAEFPKGKDKTSTEHKEAPCRQKKPSTITQDDPDKTSRSKTTTARIESRKSNLMSDMISQIERFEASGGEKVMVENDRLSPFQADTGASRSSSGRAKGPRRGSDMMGLTKGQIKAFREVFDIFDSNGGGTIDAEELDVTLRSVDICLKQGEIGAVLQTIDKDGSGEIDFGEFLQLMTNTERFLESLAQSHGGEDAEERKSAPKAEGQENLLFDALAEFMKKSALNSMDEIVGYYNTKYKKFQAPHVVNHYAAGARLIGLTDKQLKQHLERLKANNAGTKGAKSPYAQPLHIVTSTPNLSQTLEEQRKEMQSSQCRGVIRLRVKGLESSRESVGPKTGTKSGSKKSGMGASQQVPRGWLSQRICHREIKLPFVNLRSLLPFDELTAEDLPAIRTCVNHATKAYSRQRRRAQRQEKLLHWKTLGTQLIYPPMLRTHFRTVYSHYSAINPKVLTVAVQ